MKNNKLIEHATKLENTYIINFNDPQNIFNEDTEKWVARYFMSNGYEVEHINPNSSKGIGVPDLEVTKNFSKVYVEVKKNNDSLSRVQLDWFKNNPTKHKIIFNVLHERLDNSSNALWNDSVTINWTDEIISKRIECQKCNRSWNTKSKAWRVSCPSCGTKVKNNGSEMEDDK